MPGSVWHSSGFHGLDPNMDSISSVSLILAMFHIAIRKRNNYLYRFIAQL